MRLVPQDRFALKYRGACKLAQQLYNEALVDLDLSVKLDSQQQDYFSFLKRGVLKRYLNDLNGSLSDLMKSDSLKQDYFETLRELAITKMKVATLPEKSAEKDTILKESLDLLRRTRELKPNDQQIVALLKEVKDLLPEQYRQSVRIPQAQIQAAISSEQK